MYHRKPRKGRFRVYFILELTLEVLRWLYKSGANLAINEGLDEKQKIIIRQVKYLNNGVEQDHRGIKRLTKPMMGFKDFVSATATLAGIELCHMIRKGQHVLSETLSTWKQFYALAG